MASGSLLVVDDEESVAVTMGAILEMDGYTVAISTSGADALRRLDQDDFDLVLTDLRLDDVDGWRSSVRSLASSRIPSRSF